MAVGVRLLESRHSSSEFFDLKPMSEAERGVTRRNILMECVGRSVR